MALSIYDYPSVVIFVSLTSVMARQLLLRPFFYTGHWPPVLTSHVKEPYPEKKTSYAYQIVCSDSKCDNETTSTTAVTSDLPIRALPELTVRKPVCRLPIPT